MQNKTHFLFTGLVSKNVEVNVRLAPPLPVRMSLETILSLGLGLRIGIATKLVPVTTRCTWFIVKMIGRGKTDSCAGYILYEKQPEFVDKEIAIG